MTTLLPKARPAALRPLLLLALLVLACKPRAAITPTPAASLARLCGTWTAHGRHEGEVVQERWRQDPAGLRGDGLTFDAHGAPIAGETMWILLSPHGSTYRAQPADAAAATDFEQLLTPGERPDPTTWVWINPTHDFPNKIRYQLTAADRLHVQIEGTGDQGQTRALEWHFVRVEPCT